MAVCVAVLLLIQLVTNEQSAQDGEKDTRLISHLPHASLLRCTT